MHKHKMTSLNLYKIATVALVALAGTGSSAAAQLRVVATTPDLASVAREIGGSAVTVTALAKPTEDPHYVDAKPSHIVTLNRADALIEGGAELELGWLPPLLENSRDARISAGAPGRIVAIDPKSAATYKTNLARFNARLDAKTAEWQKLLAPYRGAKVVTYHKDFVYFAARFGLDIVEELEPKPGIAPSPAHLAAVIGKMKATNARAILVQPYQNRKTAETVARQAGAVVVDVPQQPGARSNTTTYFDMMDNLVNTLAGAFRAQK